MRNASARIGTSLAFFLILLARSAPAMAAEPKRMEWKVDDLTREALVTLPEGAKGAPIVFAWHGHGGSMKNASRSFALHELWPEAIVVYPQGLPTVGALTDPEGKKAGWQQAPGAYGDRDLKFFDAMLETFKSEGKADPARVYTSGHSNGGRMVYMLWATRPDAIAAFAPSASPATGLLARMKPKPCLHVAGETDKLVAFANQQKTMDRVRVINGCEAEGKPWGDFKGKVTLYPSPTKTPLITAIYPGGHEYPREARAVIVKFFKEQDGK